MLTKRCIFFEPHSGNLTIPDLGFGLPEPDQELGEAVDLIVILAVGKASLRAGTRRARARLGNGDPTALDHGRRPTSMRVALSSFGTIPSDIQAGVLLQGPGSAGCLIPPLRSGSDLQFSSVASLSIRRRRSGNSSLARVKSSQPGVAVPHQPGRANRVIIGLFRLARPCPSFARSGPPASLSGAVS